MVRRPHAGTYASGHVDGALPNPSGDWDQASARRPGIEETRAQTHFRHPTRCRPRSTQCRRGGGLRLGVRWIVHGAQPAKNSARGCCHKARSKYVPSENPSGKTTPRATRPTNSCPQPAPPRLRRGSREKGVGLGRFRADVGRISRPTRANLSESGRIGTSWANIGQHSPKLCKALVPERYSSNIAQYECNTFRARLLVPSTVVAVRRIYLTILSRIKVETLDRP